MSQEGLGQLGELATTVRLDLQSDSSDQFVNLVDSPAAVSKLTAEAAVRDQVLQQSYADEIGPASSDTDDLPDAESIDAALMQLADF